MGTIAEKLTYLEGTKSAIKDAIIAKGVEVTDTDTFRSYAEKIESIEAGGSCESQSKEINITDNGTRVVTPDEGYLLDQVTVTTNVTTGKPELPNGISFKNSTWTTFDTDLYDWSQIYSGTEMFNNCWQLQTLTGTGIENAYFLDMYSMFHYCTQLQTLKIQGRPVNTSNAFSYNYNLTNVDWSGMDWTDLVNAYAMFEVCNAEALKTIDFSNSESLRVADFMFYRTHITTAPNINCSKVETAKSMFQETDITEISLNMPHCVEANELFRECKMLKTVNLEGFKYNDVTYHMFWKCDSLETVNGLDCSSVGNLDDMFYQCSNLKNINGLKNLGAGFTYHQTLDLSYSSLLTLESVQNIINNLYDLNLLKPVYKGTIKLHSDVFALVPADYIELATSKNWIITT